MKPLHFFVFLLLFSLTAACQRSTIPVAQSGGGTFSLPLGNAKEMAKLQGIGLDPAPSLQIPRPQPEEILPTGKVEVRYTLKNYEVGHESGQHVHVILD